MGLKGKVPFKFSGLIVVFLLLHVPAWAQTHVLDTLYINRGAFQAYDSSTFAYLAFNPADTFIPQNKIISIEAGQVLDLTLINNDTLDHAFEVSGVSGSNANISAGDTANISLTIANSGLYIYYDPSNFPANCYLGLSGMIEVKEHAHVSFYWNIKEHRNTWNDSLVLGHQVDWTNYYPNYFTVNGLSNPYINDDPIARITGQVGDTLVLNLSNTGHSIHSIHFHGYHATILYSSKFPGHKGRSKDTFGVYPMETLILQLVPDKAGEFPVHDHNLVAVSGGGLYPNGMFATILITP